mmetsp:Transcript_25210/g.45387  ORF Transcript_25210/g.45387 Transcript_25210/m.45387 type:complete len:224 (-) Transcript_25210:288-959(-)
MLPPQSPTTEPFLLQRRGIYSPRPRLTTTVTKSTDCSRNSRSESSVSFRTNAAANRTRPTWASSPPSRTSPASCRTITTTTAPAKVAPLNFATAPTLVAPSKIARTNSKWSAARASWTNVSSLIMFRCTKRCTAPSWRALARASARTSAIALSTSSTATVSRVRSASPFSRPRKIRIENRSSDAMKRNWPTYAQRPRAVRVGEIFKDCLSWELGRDRFRLVLR